MIELSRECKGRMAGGCQIELTRGTLVIAIALALAGGPATAATFTVTSVDDAGPGTLREAVLDANATPGPDIIEFAPGLGEIGLQTEIEILETLSINGPAGQQAIRAVDSSRLLVVPTAGADLTLQNLSLSGGETTEVGGSGCIDYGNGGAVCSVDDVTLVGTTIADSGTFGDSAGGGGLFALGFVTLENSTLTGNFTSDGPGRGGGLFADAGLVMNYSTVSGNSTSGDNADGGGIWFGDDAQIANSVIAGNSTSGDFADGGGLAGFGTLVLADSSLVGNSTLGADSGGGGASLSSTGQIINSTVSGNSTAALDAPGGGVLVEGTNLAVFNSTVTNNLSAAGAGGIESRAVEGLAYVVQVESSIISGNTGPNDNLQTVPGSGTILVNVTNSAFGDAPSEITGTSSGNLFSNSPGLAALDDNGCATPAGAAPDAACPPTHLPAAGSPVIDRGSNPLALDFDQRGGGFPRTRDGVTDIGALEADVPPMPPVPADLRVSKSDGDVVIAPGEVLIWQIEFANIGELDGQDVALLETVPASTMFNAELSGDWICDTDGAAGSECRFEIGALPAGETGTTFFAVTVDEVTEADATAIVNTIEIVGAEDDGSDPNPANNIAVESTPLSGSGRLRVPGRSSEAGGAFLTGFGDPAGDVAAPRLGAAAAGIGDLDGDGLADVAVSAPGQDAVLLVPGRPFDGDALPLSAFLSPAFPGFLIDSDDGFVGLGDRIAGIGDANGDGFDDLVYTDAAIDFSSLTGLVRGAWVQTGFGTPPAFVVDQGGRFSPQEGVELESRQAAGPFATTVGGLGDINADGLDDYALAFRFGAPPFQRDTVFVLFGNPGLVSFQQDNLVVEDASASSGLQIFQSGSEQIRFGASISGIGDFNGDGVEDFAIGAPGQNQGTVFVLFGSPSIGDAGEGFIDTEDLDGSIGFALRGGSDAVAFGARVVGAGDFDGDGLDDLLVSEQRPTGQPGRAHIVFGSSTGLSGEVNLNADSPLRYSRLSGAAANDDFGIASAGLGDIDGDGFDDLGLGAPGLAEVFDGQVVADTGRVFVLLGTAEPMADYPVGQLGGSHGYWLTAPAPGTRFGADVAGPGDFDGDGVPDVLVTAPDTAWEGFSRAGQFWVLSGALRPEPGALEFAIREFTVAPDSLFVGDTVEIAWVATPDDPETVCAGSGLPGTEWETSDLPAAGSRPIDTSALAPGTWFPTLTCERDGETIQAEATLEVLEPATALSLVGSATPLPFFGDRFVQLELSNPGEASAESITLDVDAPVGFEAIDVFRLAASCGADDAGNVVCDAGSIPDWQCETAPAGIVCQLDALPAEATAGVLVQLRGQGAGLVEARARAANAATVSVEVSASP